MQHTAHDDAVAGKGADEGVVSSGGNSELQDLLFAVVEQFGVVEDAVAFRDEAVFKTFGAHDDGGVHDGIRLAWFHNEQVVRHDVGIGKREFDLLACFFAPAVPPLEEAAADELWAVALRLYSLALSVFALMMSASACVFRLSIPVLLRPPLFCPLLLLPLPGRGSLALLGP